MKKIVGSLTLIWIVLISCSNENQPDPQPKKITIKTPSPTIIIKDPPEKTTTISVDKNGIQVHTKRPGEETQDSTPH